MGMITSTKVSGMRVKYRGRRTRTDESIVLIMVFDPLFFFLVDISRGTGSTNSFIIYLQVIRG